MNAAAVVLGWYLILRIAQGGATIGPFDSRTICNEALDYFESELKALEIELIEAECVWKQAV